MFEADQTHSLPRENLDARHPGIRPSRSTPRAPRYTFANGEVVLDRFRIISVLGSGGMGEVYEAEDLQLGRVALKTIRGEILGNPALLDRFRREVHLARRVSHPGVCRIHELFSIESRQPGTPATLFLSMELLKGQTLAQKLQQDGPYPWREAEILIRAVCHALDAIHAEGVIHRDLKPSNIMLVEKDGACRVVLTDFGLALDTRAPDNRAQSTNGHSADTVSVQPTGLAGTLDYMAPEQFVDRSVNNSPVTPATDAYALGIVLYELVTGRNPYAPEEEDAPAPNVEAAPNSPHSPDAIPAALDVVNKRKVTTDPVEAAIRRGRRPPRPSSLNPHIPHGWDKVIYQCLEYHPGSRYQTAKAVAQALHTHRTTAGSLTVQTKSLAKRPAGWAIAATLLAATAAGTWYWHHRQPPPPPPELAAWYQKGLEAIREGTYVKATNALQMAAQKDPSYAMAHARLAEAWSELDFTGNAQQEMLKASALEQKQRLTSLDAEYIHAIRDTLTHDYTSAQLEYEHILNALPDEEKSDGYVDLGRVQEKQGKIPDALSAYQAAARRNADSPAALVHLAILESRLQKQTDATAAFDHAAEIYKASSNAEGSAELDYERGYSANMYDQPVQAQHFLEQSLKEAQEIGSIQLEIRALTQLSNVASNADRDDEAIDFAQQAVRLARKNQLDAWAAEGMIELAAALLDQKHLQQAEDAAQEALETSRQGRQPRFEAKANLILASVKDQEHLPDQVVQPAQMALNYYQQNGYFGLAASASTLLIRTERSKGNLNGALQSANQLFELATRSGDHDQIGSAEETLGTIYLQMEQYPNAYFHFEKAMAAAETQARKPTRRHTSQTRCGDWAAIQKLRSCCARSRTTTCSPGQ